MVEPRLTQSRQPQELLGRLYYHCMISRWDYLGKPAYMACLAAAQSDLWPLLAATPADPKPTHRKAHRIQHG